MRMNYCRHPALPVVLLSVAMLSACAVTPPAPASARLPLQLAPATLGSAISLQQHLKVERNGRSDELDTVLEIDQDQLRLVGLAFGQRVMTLQYDGKQLHTWRHLMLPSAVQGEDVLRDVQLTLWPLAAIRTALPAGWEIEETGANESGKLQRTLWLNHTLVTQIDYPDRLRWGGTVILTNIPYHYTLTIQSVVSAP
jgi:hypothetical protein